MRACDAAIFAESIIDAYFQKEEKNSLNRIGTRNIHPFRVNEETLTETMLLDLATEFPDIAQIKTFTKQAEDKNGADWVWRLNTHEGAIDMLVQAKRINEAVSTSPDWSFSIPKQQQTKLIKTAENLNLNSIYCFYMPAARIRSCRELMDRWNGRLYKFKDQAQYTPIGSVYLSPANLISAKNEKYLANPDRPLGITLAELMCCIYTDRNEENHIFDPYVNHWRETMKLSRNVQSFDGLVEKIMHNKHNSIAGALELSISDKKY